MTRKKKNQVGSPEPPDAGGEPVATSLVAVVKKNGREVGRVRAASPRAMRYIESFGECQVEFVEDRAFCEADAFLGNL